MKKFFGGALASLLAIGMVSCNFGKSALADPASLQGEWTIVEAKGISTKESTRPATITFTADGKINGCAAVNSFFGDYTFDGKTLSFDHVGMTRMMGDEESMKIEDAVIDAINKAKTAEVQKDKATLFDAEGNEVIELKK